MSLLKQTFSNLEKENKKALGIFLTSNYPDKKTYIELMQQVALSGADFIEVGMPFSDPSADGPTIKQAGEYAIKTGVNVKSVIESIKEFRKINSTTPIVWMGYFNSIFSYGISKFLKEIAQAGVDGLLIVDLPIEEYERIDEIKNYDIDLIHLVTPTTKEERLNKILNNASGFIYYISVNGITGDKVAQEDGIKTAVEFVKSKTKLPVLVGFGIKDGQKAKKLNEFSDGVIVGSAVINYINEYVKNNNQDKNDLINKIANFVKNLK